MAFGSGVLIATLCFSILPEAFSHTQTLDATIIGFILGGLSHIIANAVLERKSKPKASTNIHRDSPVDKDININNMELAASYYI